MFRTLEKCKNTTHGVLKIMSSFQTLTDAVFYDILILIIANSIVLSKGMHPNNVIGLSPRQSIGCRFFPIPFSISTNNNGTKHLKLKDVALNAFMTFESKMRDWAILAGRILKCFSQENMGQNTVWSGIHDIACTGNIVSGDVILFKRANFSHRGTRPFIVTLIAHSIDDLNLYRNNNFSFISEMR